MGSATPLSSVPVPLVVPRPQRLTRGDAAVPRSVLDTPVVAIDPAAVPRAPVSYTHLTLPTKA